MHQVVHQGRWHRVVWRVTLVLTSALVALVTGCVQSSAHDPAKAKLLRQLRQAYLFDVDIAELERLSVPEIVAHLDADTHLVEVRPRSLDFIRGFEPEGSVVAVRELGGGRGYVRLAFFGRRTLADVQKALNGFAMPLCALIIDLRDNAGGSFEQALRLAALFLPPGTPLAIYENREGQQLLSGAGTAAPRPERLMIWINANTASSAELFAGILQWYRRAELSGGLTAGKRTVQGAIRLDQNYLLFLTTGRYLAPNGAPFGIHGLTPDHSYEGDDVASLMAPCTDTKTAGP